jgi:hypothetical protein
METDEYLNKKIYTDLLSRKGSLKAATFSEFPEQVKIEPEDDDYKNKYFTRYFAIKSSDKNGVIFEVDVAKYNELKNNPFYRCELMRWKISGVYRSEYDNGIRVEEGVIDFNEKAFNRLRKKMPDVQNKIKSLTEFYKAN